MKSTVIDEDRKSITVFIRQKGKRPDMHSKAWLDWCWVWDQAEKGRHQNIKRWVDAGLFDYDDFVMIWKATKGKRDANQVGQS